MWKDYKIYTTREKIIERAKEGGIHGGFVCTDGAWCMTRTPREFKEMLEHFFGFKVTQCQETKYSTAIAITECGLKIAWNGNCSIFTRQ